MSGRNLTLGMLIAAEVAQWMAGQTAKPPSRESVYAASVQPVLEKYCYACHNEKLKTADLNLEALREPATAVSRPEVWERVRNKLAAGQMPPRGLPAPAPAESGSVVAWAEALIEKSQHSSGLPDGSPGRVTARRLNRVEYANTVRDLLGVHAGADEFPVDDAGYGFDNIGDVLTISPLLMEKYIAAAKKISRLAVFGETLPKEPTLLVQMQPKKGPAALLAPGSGVILPYSIRGAAYGTYVFPVDGEYEFRVKVINHRDAGIDYNGPLPEFLTKLEAASHGPSVQEGAALGGGGGGGAGRGGRGGRGPRAPLTPEQLKAREEKDRLAFPPVRMLVTFDGKQILEGFIEGNTNYQYDRGAFIARIAVKAGQHSFRASFPELADLDDPRRNINPDGRRRLYIESMDIAGPYNPSAASLGSRKIFICPPSMDRHSAACANTIVTNLLRHAYRRPVTQDEVAHMASLVTLALHQGDSFEEGIRLVVQAVLMSPDFLFRIAKDQPVAGTPAVHRISDYELASRLSYFLWSSMPDDELFRLAAENRLHLPAVLQAQLQRMMTDPKSQSLVDDFAGQWLGIRALDHRPPDPDKFPTVDDEILDDMHRETNLFVSTIIHEDRSVLDFIDARFTWLNGPLAAHYGIPGVKGEGFQRVSLSGAQRGGVLTQGSVLIVSAYPTRTSVVTRGKWVLENFLGTPPPPPPPDVPSLKESDIGASATLREKMEQHRADPKCAVCHLQMDPIGFSLENYDAAGAWRINDGRFPIDAGGQLPDGRRFVGARGLEDILRAKSDLFTRNLTEKMLTYALGRGLEPYDRVTVDRIARDVAQHDFRFSRLVKDVIESDAFQMRSAEGAKL
ncbi:MAG TPA: DUF1592 domain-containing protein [Bryobacteraceae bacterium]|nr:DUF1592 domain-containing protein [Bryobacteraceae bacterium]